MAEKFTNPYRPGAGHMPTYLAGRDKEKNEFSKLLKQTTILDNLIITGLRGVGKTVLLETLKPVAISAKWHWVGTDLSESVSLTEMRVVVRLLADLAVVTSAFKIPDGVLPVGTKVNTGIYLTYEVLIALANETPGLMADKLKAVLEIVWACLKVRDGRGIIFAYDEAQNMTDHVERNEFPLSLMLDVFQSIQKKGIPFMLVFVGLPTLYPKLVETRTYSERMFHVLTLDRLSEPDSREAIQKPIADAKCPVVFVDTAIQAIIASSGGYPYFIQFICREMFDAYLQRIGKGGTVLVGEIIRKLDSDFFMGRWSNATDRQRDLLRVISNLENSDAEFTVQEVFDKSAAMLEKQISKSQINHMFVDLSDAGLIYRNRHGRYSFAVPLLGEFILRQKIDPKPEQETGT